MFMIQTHYRVFVSIAVTSAPMEEEGTPTAIILGGIFGGLFLIISMIILYRLIVYCRWRAWLKSDIDVTIWEDTRPRYSYPITDKYMRFDVPGERGRKYTRYPGVDLKNMDGGEHERDPISNGQGQPYNGSISTVSYEHITPQV